MNISKKKHLEMILENVPKHPNPKVELEQYSTPATIAADLLWNAYSIGDIGGKSVIDLGCGCGIFTFGSLLLGAKTSLGIDIDKESIDLAKYSLE
ncbi:MAG: 50S ribosomal protein L11 methyltransferase [archaeon]|nr:50S ribosomal protein L11 methyltransferase [archaeon]